MKELIINQFNRRKTFIKFILVGATGTLVNMFFLFLFKSYFLFSLQLAGIIAIELSVVNNFIFNDRWTFSQRARKIPIFFRFMKYNLSILLGLFINYLTLLLLTNNLGVYYLLSNLIGIALSTISNYLFSSRWAWRRDE